MEDRKARLTNALAQCKLCVRDDSSLCNQFLQGHAQMHESKIADEMAVMHWLHNYTSYNADLKSIKEYLINSYGPYKGVWRQAAQCAKLYHLSKLPPKCLSGQWPWLD